jgi:NADPH:quinone reductase-like Zn-dependent oxidoreductase
MKAICVTEKRTLEVRDIPVPEQLPSGHILVELDSATITHGDKFFLTKPLPGGGMSGGRFDVYGSNGAGRVVALGPDVPLRYADRQVAIYKTLIRSSETVGLWSEQVLVPYQSTLILPDHVNPRDYNGSFANVLTVYAYLADIKAMGHNGIIVTAGTSATGRIAASLTRTMGVPAIFLVRSGSAKDELAKSGVEHVFVTNEMGLEQRLEKLAADLGTTAVFDGLGGELLTRILPVLPMSSTVHIYGFLGGPNPISLPTMLVMGKDLRLRRFSNLESPTVANPEALAVAVAEIEGLIDDPLFRTRIGKEFRFEEIDHALAYEESSGQRAVLIAQ